MRYAICNETFAGWPHARACEFAAACGYAGLEVAPFTLAPLITDVSPAERRELRRVAEANGLTVLGLHWLLAKTEGFYLTSLDESVRERTGQYLADLARAARDLGGDTLVLGSPKQRNLLPGVTRHQADEYALDTIRHCLPALDEAGVNLCLEPLSTTETDFLTSAAEAVGLIGRVNHGRVKLHLDVKAMAGELAPAEQVIRANAPYLGHFHANDPNLRGPGFGDADFRPILAALADIGYAGFVSVEVFDYAPDAETVARESIRYLKECEA